MNYTSNYHLPQWEKSDRIMMDDFNAAMAAIDDGISSSQSTAEEAAKMYATGTYEGNGGTLTVNVGFRPRFLVITNQAYSGIGGSLPGLIAAGTENLREVISYHSSGFTLTEPVRVGNHEAGYPRLNTEGTTYGYIAFR